MIEVESEHNEGHVVGASKIDSRWLDGRGRHKNIRSE